MHNSKMPKLTSRLLCMLLVAVFLLSTFTVFAFADSEEVDASDAEVSSEEIVETDDAEEAEDEEDAEESEELDNIVSADGSSSSKKEELTDDELREIKIEGFERKGDYSEYFEKYEEYNKKMPAIKIDPLSYESTTATVKTHEKYEGKKNVLEMTENGHGEFVYNITVAKTGMYAVEVDYFAFADKVTRDLEFGILIDGKAPFSTAESLTLKRNWADDGEVQTDQVGNELLPKQIIKPEWIKTDFYEPNGNFNEPLMFYLTAGEHKFTLKSISGTFALASIRLHNDGETISYEDYIAKYDAKGAKDATEYLELEAEDYTDKSDSILQNAYDRSDPKVTPYSVTTTVFNTFGGNNWNTSLQRVNYTIDVKEAGYYELIFRYRQSFMRGTTIYRKLFVDDVLPFKEAEALAFEYGTGYQVMKAGKEVDGEFTPYKVYLDEGEHTISLQAVIGDMAKPSRDVETAVYKLNYIYRKIIMITGTSPDTYRDYQLFENVHNLKAMFVQITDTLKEIKEEVDAVSTNSGGESEILNTLVLQIESFIDKPYTIPSRLSTFKDNISTLGSWMINIRDIPLQLDKIVFAGADAENLPRYKSNFGEKVAHEVKAFVSSFIDDYTAIGGTSNEEDRSVTAWVGTGRDQAITLKTLVDNYFTPETGIKVNVSLVPLAVLSKAIVAGRGPDVALHISRTEPLNLGFRNAFVNLKEFDDYEDVTKRFTKYAMVPYTLKTTDKDGNVIDKAFALPETQNFTMMFYRKDVFEELNIKVPNTWDEFDQVLPVIQQNNMTVGIDSAGSTNLFYALIMQNGGQVFYEDGSQTYFTEQYAVDAFTKWTDYYTLYDFPLSYSWYTRFRNGEMPLVFEAYSNITYLAESAPELAGLWGVAPMPGVKDSTGKINRTEQSSGLSACSIVVNKTKNKEQKEADSWEFLKWWTSTETMTEYGNRIEMAIGPVARYTTANVDAFELLNWTTEEAKLIKEQREWVKEIPELVGGYYVTRSITNAFRNVTNNYTNPREMLFYYNDQINDEIWRKRKEYNLSVPEEANK